MTRTSESARARVFAVLEGTADDGLARAFAVGITLLILLNVLAIVLETVESVGRPYAAFFAAFEWASVAVFTIEYALRLWSAGTVPRFRGAGGRVRFALTPLAVIDVLAILPTYLVLVPAIGVLDLAFLRMLRLFRFLRVLKLKRYSDSLQVLAKVTHDRRQELVVSLSVVGMLLVVSASLVYMAEHDAQPEAFSSIPAAMWWSIITLTTIGYGDVYPITPIGRALGAMTAILGVGMVALPTGILAGGFMEEMQSRRRTAGKSCPHCGNALDAPPEAGAVEVVPSQ